jgi:hypothetical protein
MNKLWSKDWWEAAGTRAIKTFAQTFVGSVAVGMAISDINWLTVASVAAVASVLSLMTSIAGLPEVKEENE